ncbi:MAG: FapA family protein, partial [Psychromonas sp.]|nr:FapA family protein [Psychromonas sp.]
LIRKFSHLSGQDGMTVTGEVLTHTAGEDIPFHIGENTKISESDPNLLIATAYGTPVALDVGMKVESSLRILTDIAKNKVPIHHDGTLIIKGDIPAGTNITATGDITVIGFIESSEVQCSGDLFVSKGILGEKPSENSPNLNCKIKCAGSIYANFIQYAKIVVGQDLNLQYQLIHCSVLSGGAINVINKEQQKGTIFGGYLCARKGIHTVTLGAISGVKTIVDLNPYYEQLHNHKKHLNSLIKQIKEKLQGAFDAQHKLTRLEYSEKTIQLSKRLISTIKELKNQLSLLNDKIEDNQNRTQHYLTNTNVTARKAVHLNVSVSIGKEIFKAKQKYGATTIRIKNHKLAAETYRE